MKNWTKEEAINKIEDLISQAESVSQNGRKSQQHIRWLSNTLDFLEEVFGNKSRYYLTLSHFSWQETGSYVVHGWDFQEQIENNHRRAFITQMNQAKGLLLSASDKLKEREISEVYEGESSNEKTTELITIINIGEKKLRKIIRNPPEKEKEVQDKFEDLLVASDIEYSREFPYIEYSSKKYIPDFSFEKQNLVVEIKLCKADEKLLISQINDDILAYRTKFKNILFLIYDLGNIRDVDIFKKNFENYDDVIVQIIKH